MSNADIAMSTMAHRRPHFHDSQEVLIFPPPPPTSRSLPWHNLPGTIQCRLGSHSPSLPQMVGGEATTSCHHICAFFGEFGFTVQFVLAFLSFSALIFKRYQVRNLRPTQAWSLSREVFRRYSLRAKGVPLTNGAGHTCRKRRGDRSKYFG